MEFNETVKKRASIRKFSPKKFDMSVIIDIIETANLSPSPGNLPILQYIIVEDTKTIQKIAQACQQPFVSEAPYIVVVCSKAKDCNILYDDRSSKYIKHHAGAAIQTILLKITDLGLASCWVGAFSDFTLKNILKLTEDIEIEAVLPIGFKSKTIKDNQKKKPSLEKRLWFEYYKNKYQLKPAKSRREDV